MSSIKSIEGLVSLTSWVLIIGYKTEIMGASFRNKDEILELAGCDLLTIAPKFLQELSDNTAIVAHKLNSAKSQEMDIKKIIINEKSFRWQLNQDSMANEKLAEGIKGFTQDIIRLENFIMTNYLS